MTLSKKLSHLAALQSKHAQLDHQLVEAYQNYADDSAVTRMKQEKLSIKAEITQLQQEIAQLPEQKA